MSKILFVNLYDFVMLKPFDVPIGIQSLLRIVNNSDRHIAEICDFNNYYYENKLIKKSLNEVIEDMTEVILSYSPDIVSFYTMCNNYYLAILLSKYLKPISNIKIILAGPHATMVANETLNSFDFIDYIGMGEGENTILPIVDSIIRESFEKVEGLAYRDSEKGVVIKWNRNHHFDLDSLDVVIPIHYEAAQKTSIDIEVGRGCPFRCTFCSTQNFWGNKYRVKSLTKIFKELDYYTIERGITNFSFQHDLFTFDQHYIKSFCTRLIQGNYNIDWGCSSRIDVIDEEVIELMAASGCTKIFFGIETGSIRIQRETCKLLDLGIILDQAHTVKKNRISAIYSFIYGFPNETIEDINGTLKLMYELKRLDIEYKEGNTSLQLWPLSFLPGSTLGERYKNEVVFGECTKVDFSYCAYMEEDAVKNLIREHKDIFLNYYNYPDSFEEEFRYLNLTFMTLFNNCYKYVHRSFDEILRFLEYDFMKFYKGFFRYNQDKMYQIDINYIISQKFTVKDEIINFVKLLVDYVVNSKEFKNAEQIIDMVTFDYMTIDCIFSSEDTYKTFDFDYDVFDYMKSTEGNISKRNTSLRFVKADGKALISRINVPVSYFG